MSNSRPCRGRPTVARFDNHAPVAPPNYMPTLSDRKFAFLDQGPHRIGDDLRIPVKLLRLDGLIEPFGEGLVGKSNIYGLAKA